MNTNEKVSAPEIQRLSRREAHNFDFASVHDAVDPIDVREAGRVLARIRKGGSEGAFEPIRVWRLSPLGVELVADSLSDSFNKGQVIDLELVVSGQRTVFEGLVVDLIQNNELVTILGVRLAKKVPDAIPGVERRTVDRWLCSDDFLPTCVAPTPGRFDDYMYFQVRDISADGLQLSCSLRNKFLIPGMRLALTAVFPMAQVIQLDVEVVRVGISNFGGRDRLVIGTRFRSITEQARTILGQYILQFSNVETLENLRKQGLAPRSLAAGIDFYNVRTEEDYRAVLELRYIAHAADGNVREGMTPEDLADINDARSRIIIGKYKGRVVATSRIVFSSIDEPLEHEAHVEWPKTLPRRDQIIESSRTAIHPDFRKNDLLSALFRFVYLTCTSADRPWVVMSCLDHMVPYYRKIGFRPTGLRHTEPQWKDDRYLNIMMANIHELASGKGVNPFYWNIVWRDVALYFSAQGSVDITGIDKVRLMAYKSLAPVTGAVLQLMRLTRPRPRPAGSNA